MLLVAGGVKERDPHKGALDNIGISEDVSIILKAGGIITNPCQKTRCLAARTSASASKGH